jgi:hypothetical protein
LTFWALYYTMSDRNSLSLTVMTVI